MRELLRWAAIGAFALLGIASRPPPAAGQASPVLDVCFRAVGVNCSSFHQAYLTASNKGGRDRFGYAVSIDGDTLVVGAPYEDSFSTGVNGNELDNTVLDSGAAYVFVRNLGTWTQEAYLKASNTEAGDRFGSAVAVSGDTVAVGAPLEDGDQNSLAESGAVYIFSRSNGEWAQQQLVKAPAPTASDRFGSALSLDGDALAVGTPGDRQNPNGPSVIPNSGAVHMYTRTNGAWALEATVKASNAEADDAFGHALVLSGDTLVAGAPNEASGSAGVNANPMDNSKYASGAAYVFTKTNGAWAQQTYIKSSNPDLGDRFGWAIALSGDTLAVSAIDEDSNATGIDGDQTDNSANISGAVYVFVRSGGVWSQQAYVKASDTRELDRFGESIAIAGDRLVVGAPDESSNASGVNGNQNNADAYIKGAAYLFDRANGSWVQRAYLKPTKSIGLYDRYGYALAIDDRTFAVGTPGGADSFELAGGAVYIHSLSFRISPFPNFPIPPWSPSAAVFISEFHYANTGTDVGEFIEISGPAGTDMENWKVVLYDGSNGTVYDTVSLSGRVIDEQADGYGTIVVGFPSDSIQNDADGIALIDASGAVVEFLCYDGDFTAKSGPARGVKCQDIGVSEDDTTPVGSSLARTGTGTRSVDLSWNGPATQTSSVVNFTVPSPSGGVHTPPGRPLFFVLVVLLGLVVLYAITRRPGASP